MRIHRALAVLILIACIPAPFYLAWASALAGGLWATAGGAVYALWQPRIRTEDPRTTWRHSFGATLACWLVIAAGIALGVMESLPDTVQWIGVAMVGLTSTLSMVLGHRGTALMTGPDRHAIADELWWANAHKAGYWACFATGTLGGILFLALAIDLVQSSALVVAGILTLAVWAFFAVFQFWLEWRTDV